jgi:hypothetical protein
VAETSYPVAGGAGVNEYTYELLMAQSLGTGRVEMYQEGATTVSSLLYADSTGRNVKVAANSAYIVRGYRWESGSDVVTLPLAANTSGQLRYDRVVLRLDRSNYTVRLRVLQGAPASAPVPPVATRQTGSTGFWEEPIGRVAVKSQSGTDLPSITPADVIPEHKYLMPPGAYGPSVGMPGNIAIGKMHLEQETGRVYMGAPGGNILLAENGPMTKIAAAGGWTQDNIYARRVNGTTHLQATVILNVVDRPAGTDLLVCTLPDAFRPVNDMWSNVVMSPGQVGWAYIDASDGTIRVLHYPSTYPKGGRLVIAHSYASKGVRT